MELFGQIVLIALIEPTRHNLLLVMLHLFAFIRIGKCALKHQLHALGFDLEEDLPLDSDLGKILGILYDNHGDSIALQYGGSHLVNTLDTYRKINQWAGQSRDIIESIKRYYSNSLFGI